MACSWTNGQEICKVELNQEAYDQKANAFVNLHNIGYLQPTLEYGKACPKGHGLNLCAIMERLVQLTMVLSERMFRLAVLGKCWFHAASMLLMRSVRLKF